MTHEEIEQTLSAVQQGAIRHGLLGMAQQVRDVRAALNDASLLRRLLDDHQKMEPHHHDMCALCKDTETAIAGAAPAPVLTPCRHCGFRVALNEAPGERQPYGYLWFTKHMERRFTHSAPAEGAIGEIKPLYE
jgi:hypothetical protein